MAASCLMLSCQKFEQRLLAKRRVGCRYDAATCDRVSRTSIGLWRQFRMARLDSECLPNCFLSHSKSVCLESTCEKKKKKNLVAFYSIEYKQAIE